jgi:hypothetical protein
MVSRYRVLDVRPAERNALLIHPPLEARLQDLEQPDTAPIWVPVTDVRQGDVLVGTTGILSSDGTRFIPL